MVISFCKYYTIYIPCENNFLKDINVFVQIHVHVHVTPLGKKFKNLSLVLELFKNSKKNS